jgi:hypothetical protein
MTRLICVLLTLLFSLSGPAMGEYSDFGCRSNAAKGGVTAASEGSELHKPTISLGRAKLSKS